MKGHAATIKNPALKVSTTGNNFIRNYRIVSVLKIDQRGRVLLAIYFKNLWFRKCIIKEAFYNGKALVETTDMYKRILWQFKLHQQLSSFLPIAKPIEFFEEDGSRYLVLTFINGDLLQNAIDEVYENHSFKTLSQKDKVMLLGWLIQAIHTIEILHIHGYAHRDISASNFIVKDVNQLFLLDLELVCNLSEGHHKENLFRGWTDGYSSPQQIRNQLPTVKDDIYSIGGLIIMFLTHVHPKTLDLENSKILKEILSAKIEHVDIIDLVIQCLDPDPKKRPELKFIKNELTKYHELQL